MKKQVNFQHGSMPQIKSKLLPVLVGLLLGTLVCVLWFTLDQREQVNLHNKIKAESEYMATHVDADLRSRIPALQRMVRRWELSGGSTKGEFIADARAYMFDTPGFQALEWVDKDCFVRWIIPIEGNEKALKMNLASEEKRRIAMEKAKDSKSPTVTSPIELVQGGKGFLIFFPLTVYGEFDGFILTVFRIQEWLDYVFNIKEYNSSDNFRISVYFDGVQVFEQSGWNNMTIHELESMSNTKILDRRLSIQIRPTKTYVLQNKTILPILAALLGLLLSVLVAFIVYLLQKAFVEAWETHVAKVALETESQERKKIEDELKNTLSRLDMATKAGGIGVWEWNISDDTLSWNERMYDLYDVPTDVKPSYRTWRNIIHPEDLSEAENLLRNAIEGKAVFNTEFRIILTDGSVQYIAAAAKVERDQNGTPHRLTGINWDKTDIKKKEKELQDLISHLHKAIDEIKTLKGIVPICSHCKKIRDDKGFWEQVEAYVAKHTEAQFSHGMCPVCMNKLYPEYFNEDESKVG